jgi:histone acetyltransferase 1
MSVEISSKLAKKLQAYNNYANECIYFKFIYDVNDLRDEPNEDESESEDPCVFHPEFTHQIFGDDEQIFGYKNLRVNYYFTPGLLDAYIGLKYDEKITPQRFEGIEADDVYKAFIDFDCSPGFTQNLNIFLKEKLREDLEFKPFGTKIHEYTREWSNENVPSFNGASNEPLRRFEIFKIDSSMSDFSSDQFVQYINRLQTMLIYYIETASFIDTDDPQWVHYILYEKIKHSASEFRYATIGYLSIYNYYAYPDKIRSRISQVIIFPLNRSLGHGAELLESIYKDVCLNPRIIDVTAESPSPEFIRLRDFVTTKLCLSLPCFNDKMMLKKGFSNEMANEAMKNYKIPKLQSRRVYEILRMAVTNQNKVDEFREFRLDIKKRLYMPFIRRSKYARNAGQSSSSANEEAIPSVETSSKLKPSLDSRFGDSSTEGTTTIGFGTSSTKKGVQFSESTTTIGFGTSTSNKASKFVRFTGNTSTSTNDTSRDLEESDEDDDDDKPSTLTNNNMFVSESERKEYLEKSFQEAVEDYKKTLKRLEFSNLLVI